MSYLRVPLSFHFSLCTRFSLQRRNALLWFVHKIRIWITLNWFVKCSRVRSTFAEGVYPYAVRTTSQNIHITKLIYGHWLACHPFLGTQNYYKLKALCSTSRCHTPILIGFGFYLRARNVDQTCKSVNLSSFELTIAHPLTSAASCENSYVLWPKMQVSNIKCYYCQCALICCLNSHLSQMTCLQKKEYGECKWCEEVNEICAK